MKHPKTSTGLAAWLNGTAGIDWAGEAVRSAAGTIIASLDGEACEIVADLIGGGHNTYGTVVSDGYTMGASWNGREWMPVGDDALATGRARSTDTPPMSPDLVGVAEAARIAGLSESSIRTYVRRGTIPDPLPIAGSDALVWERTEIQEWARTRPGPGRPPSQNTEVPR